MRILVLGKDVEDTEKNKLPSPSCRKEDKHQLAQWKEIAGQDIIADFGRRGIALREFLERAFISLGGREIFATLQKEYWHYDTGRHQGHRVRRDNTVKKDSDYAKLRAYMKSKPS